MANTIDKIPEKTRWEIATKGLTGAYIAISVEFHVTPPLTTAEVAVRIHWRGLLRRPP